MSLACHRPGVSQKMINVVSHVFGYDGPLIWVSVEAFASPHLATVRYAVLFSEDVQYQALPAMKETCF